jgi:hypothetical protein
MKERHAEEDRRSAEVAPPGPFAIFIHLGLFSFGVAAWLQDSSRMTAKDSNTQALPCTAGSGWGWLVSFFYGS